MSNEQSRTPAAGTPQGYTSPIVDAEGNIIEEATPLGCYWGSEHYQAGQEICKPYGAIGQNFRFRCQAGGRWERGGTC